MKGGIKDGNDGIAGLEWQNGWWPWTDLREGGHGNFFICAGTSAENMAFNIIQTAGGKLSDKNLVIGKWCNDGNVRGTLADVMFYVGEEVASVVTLPQ